jgi:hypothetical protein
MNTTEHMVRDEARRRMILLHGGHSGSDVTQKSVNTLILHAVAPSDVTGAKLNAHLAILDAARVLSDLKPDDYAADKYWPALETNDLVYRPSRPVPAQVTPQAVEGQGVAFNGITFAKPDMGRLALVVALATSAVAHGIQAGDFRWIDPAADFTMLAADGTPVPMDAPTLVQFAIATYRA